MPQCPFLRFRFVCATFIKQKHLQTLLYFTNLRSRDIIKMYECVSEKEYCYEEKIFVNSARRVAFTDVQRIAPGQL